MAKQLHEKLGESTVDSLVQDSRHPLDVMGITLPAGSGMLLRGTVLGRNAGGNLVPIDSGENITADCILAEDCLGEETAPTFGIAYRSGHFNRYALRGGDQSIIALTWKQEDELRMRGIYLSDAIGGAE